MTRTIATASATSCTRTMSAPSSTASVFAAMVPASRSSTGLPVEERLAGTIAAGTIAVLGGADIVRVHDVAEAVAMVKVIDAVLGPGCREAAWTGC